MFGLRKRLIKNPGASLKDFAKEMKGLVAIQIVICALIGLPVVTLMLFTHNYQVAAIVIVAGSLFVLAQHIFMVTAYGVLYGIGTLIENSKDQIKLLAYKGKEDTYDDYDDVRQNIKIEEPIEPMYANIGLADFDVVRIEEEPENTVYLNEATSLDGEDVFADEAKEAEIIYNSIEAINENFYIGSRSDKDVILNKEGSIIYSGKNLNYMGIRNFIVIKDGDKWSINDINGVPVIKTLFDSVRYDGYEKILVECIGGIKEIAEPLYFMTRYREEDKLLPTYHYILSIEKNGDLSKSSNNEIIMREMIYSFEYNTLPLEWKVLIDKVNAYDEKNTSIGCD